MASRARALEHAVRAIALGLALSLAASAWHDVSKAWDTWAYHLPFAARLAGIVGPDAYVFGPENQARFEGFPLVVEALQGLFWKITTRPECASYVALFSLFALVAFLHRVFRVPPHVALIAFLAIPLVQIHATQCYVDLPANVGATVLLLLVYRAWTLPDPPSLRALAGAAVVAIATANAKFQLVPIVVAAGLAMLARTGKQRLGVFAIALPLVFATPIGNVARHGNPVWPVEMSLFGKPLPFVDTRYESSPRWLEHAPRPARFAASVLEIGVHRWSVDQWTPPDDPGYRMGGFFGAYALLGLAGIAFAAWKKRTREAKLAAAFMAGTTLLVSLLPQSHELRYYMCWMLLLVALNLVLWSRERPLAASGAALAALGLVAWSTSGAYLYPSGESFDSLVASRVDHAVLDGVHPGERLCVAAEPWTFLYAPAFHPGARFTVQEAKRPEDCPSKTRATAPTGPTSGSRPLAL